MVTHNASFVVKNDIIMTQYHWQMSARPLTCCSNTSAILPLKILVIAFRIELKEKTCMTNMNCRDIKSINKQD